MNILGIDCGMKGALTVMSPDGDIIEKYDMPKLNKKIDLYALRDIIKEHKDCFATVEENRCIGIGSKKSMFQFGMNYAYVIMALTCFDVKFQIIAPQLWKKHFSLIKTEKSASIQKAIQLQPEFKEWFDVKTKDGRAESYLIGLYGVRHFLNNNKE